MKKELLFVMGKVPEDINGSTVECTDELKGELDKRYADYKSGKAKMIMATESKSRIEQVLNLVGRNELQLPASEYDRIFRRLIMQS